MDPNDTVIAVDLHGVLFKHNYKKMLLIFLASKKKLQLIRALLSPSLWIDTIKLIKRNGIAEQFLVGLADKHHRLRPFVPLGIAIANQQKPQLDVINILKELKKNGYKLYLFSNIGSIIFDDLHKKFPELMKLFESFTIPSKHEGYIRKPSTKAFQLYISQNGLENKKIILIDDNRKNTKAARQHGIHGIFFSSIKQLNKELGNFQNNHSQK